MTYCSFLIYLLEIEDLGREYYFTDLPGRGNHSLQKLLQQKLIQLSFQSVQVI
jgi:hypothetical protein